MQAHKPVRVFINGVGRIGKLALRRMAEDKNIDVVGVNEPSFKGADPEAIRDWVELDSTHGRFKNVEAEGDTLSVAGDEAKVFSTFNPEELPYKELGVDMVIDCTPMKKREFLERHRHSGVDHVIKSSPAEADKTVVYGVNSDEINTDEHKIISNASCTTNCSAPVLQTLDQAFGVNSVHALTIHAATVNDPAVDTFNASAPFKGRAGTQNIKPTTTGAAKAIPNVLPDLAERAELHFDAIRVPVIDGSIVDFNIKVDKPTSTEEVKALFQQAAQEGPMAKTLGVEETRVVSSDIIGTTEASIVSMPHVQVTDGGTHIKVKSWYDNERGFVEALTNTTLHTAEKAGYLSVGGAAGAVLAAAE